MKAGAENSRRMENSIHPATTQEKIVKTSPATEVTPVFQLHTQFSQKFFWTEYKEGLQKGTPYFKLN